MYICTYVYPFYTIITKITLNCIIIHISTYANKLLFMCIHMYVIAYIKLPELGHSKHCPDEANVTPDNSKQHWWKDSVLLSDNSSSQ